MTLFSVQAIKYSGPVPGALTKQEFRNGILKPAWKQVGEMFHREMLPIRFTEQAKALLGYAHRKGEEPGTSTKRFFRSYTGRKLKKFGHRKPLVWSGESRRDATRIADVRATSNGVKVVLHARKLNYRNRYSSIYMNEEVRRIATSEYPKLQRELERAVQANIDKDTSKRAFKGT